MKDLFGNERFIFIIKVASYKILNSESVGVNNKINSAHLSEYCMLFLANTIRMTQKNIT